MKIAFWWKEKKAVVVVAWVKEGSNEGRRLYRAGKYARVCQPCFLQIGRLANSHNSNFQMIAQAIYEIKLAERVMKAPW